MTEQPPPGYGYEQQHNPPTSARPGELLDRFLARLIDGVLLAVVSGIIGGIIGAIIGVSMSAGFGTGGTYAASAVSAVVGAAIAIGYYVFMETSRGQTLGKMVMKLQVIGPNGQHPTTEQSVKRNIYLLFGLAGIVPIIGSLLGGLASLVAVIMIAVGISQDKERRQAWHDKFAGGTQVLKIG